MEPGIIPISMIATPQKVVPQSAKKSAKHHKKHEAVQVAQSETEACSDLMQDGEKTPSRKHKKNRKASTARKNGVQSDAGEIFDSDGRRGSAQPPKQKMTPAKLIKSDAYAGPTFHQSPAASAIPLPSFMARSLPNPSGMPENKPPKQFGEQDHPETVHEKPREATPLDWMFDAARTKSTPAVNSQVRGISQNASPAPSPGPRKDEADFPFELDGEEEAKSTYTTPLSQRFMAAKTPHSASEGGQPLTDQERQAKTAALKLALMNPGGGGTDQKLAPPFNDNPFNARNPSPARPSPPARHVSNPSMPSTPYQNTNYNNAYTNGFGQQPNQYFNQYGGSPSRNFNQPNGRPPSSSLRNIYSPQPSGAPLSPPPSVAEPRISTARSPPPQRQLNYSSTFGAIYGQPRPSSEGNAQQDPKPNVERGLDDLRKVLNMTNLGQQN